MAEGMIIAPVGVKIGRLEPGSTTSDAGQSGYKEIVNASGMTISLGSRQLTFAHNSAPITYLDIVVTGSIVSI